MLSCFVAVRVGVLLSATSTTNVKVPAGPVGFPLITPALLLRFSPAGKAPLRIDQTYGEAPPCPDKGAEYGIPANASGKFAVRIEGVDKLFENPSNTRK